MLFCQLDEEKKCYIFLHLYCWRFHWLPCILAFDCLGCWSSYHMLKCYCNLFPFYHVLVKFIPFPSTNHICTLSIELWVFLVPPNYQYKLIVMVEGFLKVHHYFHNEVYSYCKSLLVCSAFKCFWLTIYFLELPENQSHFYFPKLLPLNLISFIWQ